METQESSQQGAYKCVCRLCIQKVGGFGMVPKNTYYKHRKLRSVPIVEPSNPRVMVCDSNGHSVPYTTAYRRMQESSNYRLRLESRASIVDPSTLTKDIVDDDENEGPNENEEEDIEEHDMHMQEDEEESREYHFASTSGSFLSSDEPEFCASYNASSHVDAQATLKSISLDDVMRAKVTQLQCILDSGCLAVKLQDEVMKLMFGDLQKTVPSEILQNGLFNIPTDGSTDPRDLSLGRILTLAGESWTGGEGGWSAPPSWNALMQTYNQLGMVQSERWRICTGNTKFPHSPTLMSPCKEDTQGPTAEKCLCSKLKRRCTLHQSRCPHVNCSVPRVHCLAFDYIPFTSLLREAFSSRSFQEDILTLWRNRKEWLGWEAEQQPSTIKEFWHGSKLRTLQEFWDPTAEFQLPVRCLNAGCKKVFRAFPTKSGELSDPTNWNANDNSYEFACPECLSLVKEKPSFGKGNPLNIAFMAHWDGWQSARTTARDCWTMEVVVLNGGKNPSHPSIVGSPLPILFIPMSSMLLSKLKDHHVLNQFPEPFYQECEEGFIHGFHVPFLEKNGPPQGLEGHWEPHMATPRIMLFNMADDAPAQAKMGGLKDGGYAACRRDIMISKLVDGKVVYPYNRYQARFPPKKRIVDETYGCLKLMEEASNAREKEEASRKGGISFASPIWRLYDLYGFDVGLDLVYDSMHILPLCLFKKFNEKLITSLSNKEIKVLETTLAEVTRNRPPGLGGRWPKKPTKTVKKTGGENGAKKIKLSYYKAEEHQLFVMYCLIPILGALGYDIKTSKVAKMGFILYEIAHLFFSYTRKFGWTRDSISFARSLFSAWRVFSEEEQGPNGAPLEHVAGNGELLDDVIRHGAHDIYWCFAFEREVSTYNSISTNKKQMELSFTKYYQRRYFNKVQAQLHKDEDKLTRYQRSFLALHSSIFPLVGDTKHKPNVLQCNRHHAHSFLSAHSQEYGMQLWKWGDSLRNEAPCLHALLNKGVAIGGKNYKDRQLSSKEKKYLERYWRKEGFFTSNNGQLFSSKITTYKSVVHQGDIYKPNNLVVVKTDEYENVPYGEPSYTWEAMVKTIFCHKFGEYYQLFFKADWYSHIWEDDGTMAKDSMSSFSILKMKTAHYDGDDIRPVHRIIHKFMMQPLSTMPKGRKRPRVQVEEEAKVVVCFELEKTRLNLDFINPGQPGCCPPWPMLGDITICDEVNEEEGYECSLMVVQKVEGDNEGSQFGERFVELCMLEKVGVKHGYDIFRGTSYIVRRTWDVLLKVVNEFKHMKGTEGREHQDRWKARVGWFQSLGLEKNKICGLKKRKPSSQ